MPNAPSCMFGPDSGPADGDEKPCPARRPGAGMIPPFPCVVAGRHTSHRLLRSSNATPSVASRPCRRPHGWLLSGAGSPETAGAGARKAGPRIRPYLRSRLSRPKMVPERRRYPPCERSCSAFWLNAPASWKPRPPGSPGELPPEAPTDPDVTLSRHPAPVIRLQYQHHANEQKDPASAERSSPELADCGGHDATIGCVSDAAMRSGAH